MHIYIVCLIRFERERESEKDNQNLNWNSTASVEENNEKLLNPPNKSKHAKKVFENAQREVAALMA